MTMLPPANASAANERGERGSPRQYSLRSLLLAVTAVAIACGVVRGVSIIWMPTIALALASGVSVWLAGRRGESWRVLRLGWLHLALWLGCGALAAQFAVRGCLSYNLVAGTDKTPSHIAQIAAATLGGPLAGPVANPGAGSHAESQARFAAAVLLGVLLLASAPFLFVRRRVAWWIAAASWAVFLAATLLWYFGAMISLGFFLS